MNLWNCVRIKQRLEGDGVTKPLLCAAVNTQTKMRETVVVKVRNPDSVYGHDGPSSLASELICSVIAKRMGLPVPDFGIIDIPKQLSQVVEEDDVKLLIENNSGKNFATVYCHGYALYEPCFKAARHALADVFEEVLGFDSTVLNADRIECNPNLLWRPGGLVMIDHSLALQSSRAGVTCSTVLPRHELGDHVSVRQLKKEIGLTHHRFFERWNLEFKDIDFEDVCRMVPEEWETRPGDLQRVIDFLNGRRNHFEKIQRSIQEVTS